MSEGKSNVGLWIAIGLGGLFALVLVVAVVFGLFWARSTVVHASHSPTRPAPGTTTTAVAIAREDILPATLPKTPDELPFTDEAEMLSAIARLDSKDVAEIPAALGVETVGPTVIDGTIILPIAQPTRGTLTITLEAGVVIDTQFVKNGQ